MLGNHGDYRPKVVSDRLHQQYLVKNPNGYCPVHATGVACTPGR